MNREKVTTILLVEDELLIAMNQKMILEQYGYSVITASSGEKAIQQVDDEPEIQLILMDINLGKGIDGTEAAARILHDHDIPIIFCSSHTEPEIVEKSERITSYGYVVKSSGITVIDASIKMAYKLFDAKKALKTIFDNSPDTIARFDSSLRHVFINKRATFELGLRSEDFMGKTNRQLGMPEDVVEKWESSLLAAFKSGREQSVDIDIETPSGYKHYASKIVPEFSNNQVVSCISFTRDVTERRKIEDSLRRSEESLRTHQAELQMQNEELRCKQSELACMKAKYFDLYDLMPAGYLTLSRGDMILEANLAAADLLSAPREALRDTKFTFYIAAEDQDVYYRHRRRLFESGKPQACALTLKRADGSTFPACLKAIAVSDPDGSTVCRVLTFEIETKS